MLDWLIITADRVAAGRGVRGYTLAWFLQTYYGRRRVRRCTPGQWRQSPTSADTLLIGLPSSLSAEELEQLAADRRCRRVAVFDYLDQQELPWTPEQAAALRRIAACYLRPWREEAWDHGISMGLLPTRTSRRLTTAIIADRCARKVRARPAPLYDVAFLGQPNTTRLWQGGRVECVEQRLQWLLELRTTAPDLKFWGGLMGGDPDDVARLREQYGDVSHLYHPAGKVNFGTYFRALQRSRALLAPGGNAPWSYRHYEALYAGGVVVTIDFRRREMLVPLPAEGVVHVPDRGPVGPAIREAIEISCARPAIAEEHYRFLNQYLRCGGYSRRRPLLLKRFLRQFG